MTDEPIAIVGNRSGGDLYTSYQTQERILNAAIIQAGAPEELATAVVNVLVEREIISR